MAIQMIGIDYNRASLDQRAVFAFTKSKSLQAMQRITAHPAITGCVLLSTCNRMEVWINADIGMTSDLITLLCDLKGVAGEQYAPIFITREGKPAIEHLFWLTAGLKSQILGEDQILAQVKDALATAHEGGSTDNTLEVLFRTAITATKRIKATVTRQQGSPSLASQVLLQLQSTEKTLVGLRCLVIGNGQMGQLVSAALLASQADVTVTVRPYRHHQVPVPLGAKTVLYENRFSIFDACDLVVSATSSPHFTTTADQLATRDTPLTLVDLAVPRDIDPACADHPVVTLYNVDDFCKADSDGQKNYEKQAKTLLQEGIDSFDQWQNGMTFLPQIQLVKSALSQDVTKRLHKSLQGLNLTEDQTIELQQCLDQAVQKGANKLLFGLQHSLDQAEFTKCMEGLETLYE